MWWSGKTTRRKFLGLRRRRPARSAPPCWSRRRGGTAFGQAKPYKVGVLQPLSGTGRGRRQDGPGRLADGASTASTSRGGVNGRPIELRRRRLRVQARRRAPQGREARRSRTRSTSHEGGYLSNVCLACMPVYEEAQDRQHDRRVPGHDDHAAQVQPLHLPAVRLRAGPGGGGRRRTWSTRWARSGTSPTPTTRGASPPRTPSRPRSRRTAARSSARTGIPLGTADMTPFLSKISGSFDGLFGIFFGPQGIAFVQPELRPRPHARSTSSPGDGAIAVSTNLPALGSKAEGFVGIDRYVPVLEGALNTPYHKQLPRRVDGPAQADRPVRPAARPLRAVELRGDQRPQGRHAEVGLPRPRGHDEADRGARGPGDEGERRLPAGRQDSCARRITRPSCASSSSRSGRQAQDPRGRPQGKDDRPGRPASSPERDRELRCPAAPPPPTAGAPRPILRTEGLTVRFGGLAALNNVNIAVRRGRDPRHHRPQRRRQVDVLQLPHRRAPPDGGRIVFDGEDITGPAARPDLAQGDRALVPDHQHPARRHRARERAHRRPVAPARAGASCATTAPTPTCIDRARAVLDCGRARATRQDELAANLSHGEQRNLEIGIALATEPKLLCLDEPTAGMSVTETHATVELVRRIAADLTILIVEHDMEVVMGLARTHHRAALRRGARRGHARRDPGQPARARGLPQDLMLSLRRRPHLLRQVAHPARRVASRSAPGEVVGLLGRNGVGKSHHAQDRHGPGAALQRARDASRGATSPGWRPTGWPALGIAWVPEDRRIFRLLTRAGEPPDRPRPPRRGRRAPRSELLDKVYAALPGAARAARPGGRHAVGRRAADAGHRAGHDARAEDHPARRADRGPDAAHGRRRSARSSTCCTARAWPSCSSSRTCRSRWRCRAASTSWRRAWCGTTRRPPTCARTTPSSTSTWECERGHSRRPDPRSRPSTGSSTA